MPDAPAQLTVSLVGEHPQLAAELLSCQESRGGPIPLDALFDFLKATEARARVQSGQPRDVDRTGALPRTVQVPGTDITLRSLSLAGGIALRKLLTFAPHLDQQTYDILEAWIYANSWSVAELSRLVDLDAANQIVLDWFPNLTCTAEDLVAAIHRLTAYAYPDPAPGQTPDPDPMAGLDALLKRYGGTIADMLATPLPTAAHLMDAANHAETTAAAAQARAAGRQPPAEADPKMHAERAFRHAKAKLATSVRPRHAVASPSPEAP